jgi:hypothetical protein
MGDKLDMSLDSIIKTSRKKSDSSSKSGGGKKKKNNNNNKNKNNSKTQQRRQRDKSSHHHQQQQQQQYRHHQQQKHHHRQQYVRQQQQQRVRQQPVRLAIFIHENQIFGQVGKTHLFKLEKPTGEITLNSGGYQNSRNRQALNTILMHVGLNIDYIKGDWVVGNGKGWQVPFADNVKIGSANKAESVQRFRNLFYTFKLGGKDASNPLIVEIPMDQKAGSSSDRRVVPPASSLGGKSQSHGRTGRRTFKRPY